MVFDRIASYFSPSDAKSQSQEDGRDGPVAQFQQVARQAVEVVQEEDDDDLDAARPPYIHAMSAGGIGGTTGDMLMHSLDTVKTRQQGDPHIPPKYTSMGSTYHTIWKQEGVRRGLYGGVAPAFAGSFAGTVIFFGTYEWSKRRMIDMGINPSVAYFASGFAADLAASPLYVPSEVLKTRLQLQGRHNNPYFHSGYNYRSTMHALRTIIRTEGIGEMFSGYKATSFRDLPFSALQFAFYEKEQKIAREWKGSKDIGSPLEIFTGASAGGMAGVLTCPMDVVKTRIQTQLDPDVVAFTKHPTATTAGAATTQAPTSHRPTGSSQPHSNADTTSKRLISTSGPSTALRHHGSVTLDTESVIEGSKVIYRSEGFAGWFRGVGPRFVWTSIQSGTMLVMYQQSIKWFTAHPSVAEDDS